MIRTSAASAVAAVILIVATTARANADTPTPTPAPPPQVTADIVLVVNDAYATGDVASIGIRNDGTAPYVYNPSQEACNFTFRDGAGREFEIPPATHCDLPGDRATIQPGETVVLEPVWLLDECTAPGFFCWAVRPLATGDYTVSGSLNSVDALYRAEFSKTIHITGPQFTGDSEVGISSWVVVTDPPIRGDTYPVTITLRNHGQRDYRYPLTPGCYLRFMNPQGYLFTIPGAIPCNTANEDTISPGESLDVVTRWNRDECVEFGPDSTCAKAVPLPPGTYTVKGALWSADKQAYAEFSNTIMIFATPSPAPTPGDFPRSGGPPTGGDVPSDGVVGALALGAALAALGCFAMTRRIKESLQH